MKKLLSMLLSVVLLLSVLPAQAADPINNPLGKAAHAFTMMQAASLGVTCKDMDELWLYAASQGPLDQGDVIRYCTADGIYEIAFVADARGTGVEEIHILGPAQIMVDGYYATYRVVHSILHIYLTVHGNGADGDLLTDTLMSQIVEVTTCGSRSYQTDRVRLCPGLYMSCYRNGDTYAVLLEFDDPVTYDDLYLDLAVAAEMIKDSAIFGE